MTANRFASAVLLGTLGLSSASVAADDAGIAHATGPSWTPATSLAEAFALDGGRQGFFFSAGAGVGFQRSGAEADNRVYDDVDRWGATTSLRVGYSPTDRLSLFFLREDGWNLKPLGNASELAITALSGAGVQLHLDDFVTGLYTHAALGAAGHSYPLADGISMKTGLGWQLGLGYEFLPQWSLEGRVLGAQFDYEDQLAGWNDVNYRSADFQLGVNYRWQ